MNKKSLLLTVAVGLLGLSLGITSCAGGDSSSSQTSSTPTIVDSSSAQSGGSSVTSSSTHVDTSSESSSEEIHSSDSESSQSSQSSNEGGETGDVTDIESLVVGIGAKNITLKKLSYPGPGQVVSFYAKTAEVFEKGQKINVLNGEEELVVTPFAGNNNIDSSLKVKHTTSGETDIQVTYYDDLGWKVNLGGAPININLKIEPANGEITDITEECANLISTDENCIGKYHFYHNAECSQFVLTDLNGEPINNKLTNVNAGGLGFKGDYTLYIYKDGTFSIEYAHRTYINCEIERGGNTTQTSYNLTPLEAPEIDNALAFVNGVKVDLEAGDKVSIKNNQTALASATTFDTKPVVIQESGEYLVKITDTGLYKLERVGEIVQIKNAIILTDPDGTVTEYEMNYNGADLPGVIATYTVKDPVNVKAGTKVSAKFKSELVDVSIFEMPGNVCEFDEEGNVVIKSNIEKCYLGFAQDEKGYSVFAFDDITKADIKVTVNEGAALAFERSSINEYLIESINLKKGDKLTFTSDRTTNLKTAVSTEPGNNLNEDYTIKEDANNVSIIATYDEVTETYTIFVEKEPVVIPDDRVVVGDTIIELGLVAKPDESMNPGIKAQYTCEPVTLNTGDKLTFFIDDVEITTPLKIDGLNNNLDEQMKIIDGGEVVIYYNVFADYTEVYVTGKQLPTYEVKVGEAAQEISPIEDSNNNLTFELANLAKGDVITVNYGKDALPFLGKEGATSYTIPSDGTYKFFVNKENIVYLTGPSGLAHSGDTLPLERIENAADDRIQDLVTVPLARVGDEFSLIIDGKDVTSKVTIEDGANLKMNSNGTFSVINDDSNMDIYVKHNNDGTYSLWAKKYNSASADVSEGGLMPLNPTKELDTVTHPGLTEEFSKTVQLISGMQLTFSYNGQQISFEKEPNCNLDDENRIIDEGLITVYLRVYGEGENKVFKVFVTGLVERVYTITSSGMPIPNTEYEVLKPTGSDRYVVKFNEVIKGSNIEFHYGTASKPEDLYFGLEGTNAQATAPLDGEYIFTINKDNRVLFTGPSGIINIDTDRQTKFETPVEGQDYVDYVIHNLAIDSGKAISLVVNGQIINDAKPGEGIVNSQDAYKFNKKIYDGTLTVRHHTDTNTYDINVVDEMVYTVKVNNQLTEVNTFDLGDNRYCFSIDNLSKGSEIVVSFGEENIHLENINGATKYIAPCTGNYKFFVNKDGLLFIEGPSGALVNDQLLSFEEAGNDHTGKSQQLVTINRPVAGSDLVFIINGKVINEGITIESQDTLNKTGSTIKLLKAGNTALVYLKFDGENYSLFAQSINRVLISIDEEVAELTKNEHPDASLNPGIVEEFQLTTNVTAGQVLSFDYNRELATFEIKDNSNLDKDDKIIFGGEVTIYFQVYGEEGHRTFKVFVSGIQEPHYFVTINDKNSVEHLISEDNILPQHDDDILNIKVDTMDDDSSIRVYYGTWGGGTKETLPFPQQDGAQYLSTYYKGTYYVRVKSDKTCHIVSGPTKMMVSDTDDGQNKHEVLLEQVPGTTNRWTFTLKNVQENKRLVLIYNGVKSTRFTKNEDKPGIHVEYGEVDITARGDVKLELYVKAASSDNIYIRVVPETPTITAKLGGPEITLVKNDQAAPGITEYMALKQDASKLLNDAVVDVYGPGLSFSADPSANNIVTYRDGEFHLLSEAKKVNIYAKTTDGKNFTVLVTSEDKYDILVGGTHVDFTEIDYNHDTDKAAFEAKGLKSGDRVTLTFAESELQFGKDTERNYFFIRANGDYKFYINNSNEVYVSGPNAVHVDYDHSQFEFGTPIQGEGYTEYKIDGFKLGGGTYFRAVIDGNNIDNADCLTNNISHIGDNFRTERDVRNAVLTLKIYEDGRKTIEVVENKFHTVLVNDQLTAVEATNDEKNKFIFTLDNLQKGDRINVKFGDDLVHLGGAEGATEFTARLQGSYTFYVNNLGFLYVSGPSGIVTDNQPQVLFGEPTNGDGYTEYRLDKVNISDGTYFYIVIDGNIISDATIVGDNIVTSIQDKYRAQRDITNATLTLRTYSDNRIELSIENEKLPVVYVNKNVAQVESFQDGNNKYAFRLNNVNLGDAITVKIGDQLVHLGSAEGETSYTAPVSGDYRLYINDKGFLYVSGPSGVLVDGKFMEFVTVEDSQDGKSQQKVTLANIVKGNQLKIVVDGKVINDSVTIESLDTLGKEESTITVLNNGRTVEIYLKQDKLNKSYSLYSPVPANFADVTIAEEPAELIKNEKPDANLNPDIVEEYQLTTNVTVGQLLTFKYNGEVVTFVNKEKSNLDESNKIMFAGEVTITFQVYGEEGNRNFKVFVTGYQEPHYFVMVNGDNGTVILDENDILENQGKDILTFKLDNAKEGETVRVCYGTVGGAKNRYLPFVQQGGGDTTFWIRANGKHTFRVNKDEKVFVTDGPTTIVMNPADDGRVKTYLDLIQVPETKDKWYFVVNNVTKKMELSIVYKGTLKTDHIDESLPAGLTTKYGKLFLEKTGDQLVIQLRIRSALQKGDFILSFLPDIPQEPKEPVISVNLGGEPITLTKNNEAKPGTTEYMALNQELTLLNDAVVNVTGEGLTFSADPAKNNIVTYRDGAFHLLEEASIVDVYAKSTDGKNFTILVASRDTFEIKANDLVIQATELEHGEDDKAVFEIKGLTKGQVITITLGRRTLQFGENANAKSFAIPTDGDYKFYINTSNEVYPLGPNVAEVNGKTIALTECPDPQNPKQLLLTIENARSETNINFVLNGRDGNDKVFIERGVTNLLKDGNTITLVKAIPEGSATVKIYIKPSNGKYYLYTDHVLDLVPTALGGRINDKGVALLIANDVPTGKGFIGGVYVDLKKGDTFYLEDNYGIVYGLPNDGGLQTNFVAPRDGKYLACACVAREKYLVMEEILPPKVTIANGSPITLTLTKERPTNFYAQYTCHIDQINKGETIKFDYHGNPNASIVWEQSDFFTDGKSNYTLKNIQVYFKVQSHEPEFYQVYMAADVYYEGDPTVLVDGKEILKKRYDKTDDLLYAFQLDITKDMLGKPLKIKVGNEEVLLSFKSDMITSVPNAVGTYTVNIKDAGGVKVALITEPCNATITHSNGKTTIIDAVYTGLEGETRQYKVTVDLKKSDVVTAYLDGIKFEGNNLVAESGCNVLVQGTKKLQVKSDGKYDLYFKIDKNGLCTVWANLC